MRKLPPIPPRPLPGMIKSESALERDTNYCPWTALCADALIFAREQLARDFQACNLIPYVKGSFRALLPNNF